MKIYYYEVQAVGQSFPLDMLRYDTCYPVGSAAVTGLTVLDTGTTTVRLGSSKKPTVDRWKSFGWSVMKLEKR